MRLRNIPRAEGTIQSHHAVIKRPENRRRHNRRRRTQRGIYRSDYPAEQYTGVSDHTRGR